MSDPHNDRTRESDIRELTAEFNGFKQLMDERQLRNDERIAAQDAKTTLALATASRASDKAESATERRFESVNEFRGAMSDQSRTLLPRAEADTKFAALYDKFEEMKNRYGVELASLRESRSEGQGRQQILTIVISIAVSVAVALMNILLRH